MSWYRDWFNSPLYEKIYANRDEQEAGQLADFISKSSPSNHYTRLLDLGCGRGRHSLNLAERGYTVTGIDLSLEAIKTAKEIAEERSLPITFKVADMREKAGDNFDIIVNLFTTFGYFPEDDENIKVLRNVHNMLREGGLFYLDFLNAKKATENLVANESGEFEGIGYEINRSVSNDIIQKEMRFSLPDGEKVNYTEKVKLYDKAWFEKHLQKLGFYLLEAYGDYEGNLFEADNSSRLLLLCEKSIK